jgi:hypothetical protein
MAVLGVVLILLNSTLVLIQYEKKNYKWAIVSAISLGLAIGALIEALTK